MSSPALTNPRELLCRLLSGDGDLASRALPWGKLDLLTLAVDHRVHLLLAEQLQQRGTFDQCPSYVRTALEIAVREEALVERAQAVELRAILDRLAHADIRPVLVKGVSLAHTCYPRAYLRPHLDIDLLIRKQDVTAARKVMDGAGYHRPNHVNGERVVHQFEYVKRGRATVIHAYDFHWRIANPALFADLLSFEEVDRATVMIPSLGDHARGPSAVHALFLACVHRVAHHNDSGHLIWLYDIHLLAERLMASEWLEFHALASKTGTRAVCGSGLECAAGAFRTRLPPVVTDGLVDAGHEPSATFLGGRLREIDIQLSNFRSLRNWRARWQLVLEHMFPAPTYVLNAYNVVNRAWLPALYAHRIVRGAPRWFRRAGTHQ